MINWPNNPDVLLFRVIVAHETHLREPERS
jgi:hypothetical protein